MDQTNLDYTKHCTTPFGAYVQANHNYNPHNTNVLRRGDRKNILHQDNKSTILLHENGRKSAGKWLRALNVRYFSLTDQVEKGT